MANLIDRLAHHILRDNAIFFVGGQFTAVPDQPSYLHQIADQLAARLQRANRKGGFPAIAQQYQADTGRAALIQALKEALAALPDQSAPVYKLLADSIAPHTKIITTRFDQALEAALNEARKSYIRIISDEEVSFFDESRIALIKIRGDINRAESLLITEDDLDDFFKRLPALNDVVRAFFATKTMIFLGYDLDEDSFRRFFREVAPRSTSFRRPAYAVVPTLPDSTRYWEQQNVVVHVEPVDRFLNALAEAVQSAVEQPAPEPSNPLALLAHPPQPDQPYRALDSFGRLDRAVFAGRRGQIERLANRILAHPVTVLFGESGNGKTSLLRAGVSPRLAQNQSLLLLTTPVPGQSLSTGWEDDLRQMLELVGWSEKPVSALSSALRASQARLNGPTVLALDQFEQFFVGYSHEERESAIIELRDLLQNDQLNLRLALVIREDFLGRMQNLETALPGLLDIRFRLGRLDEEAARNAIEHPVRPFGVSWQPALVERLLYDLQVDHHVAPPQLQIVCTRLYQDALAQGTNEIALARYRALGGAVRILGEYVDGVVEAMPPEQGSMARLLLGALVSSSHQVKLRLPLNDLARAADMDEETAVPILDELTEHRLIRRYQTSGGLAYELTHDYLARRIADWLGNEFWNAQRARELLRQAAPEWEARRRLLAPGDLRLVNAQRGQTRFSEPEIIVVYASSVSYGEEPDYWRRQLAEEAVEEVLMALTAAAQPFVRARAASPLTDFGDEMAASRLADLAVRDGAATVRESAAHAIAEANHQPTVKRLVRAAIESETAAAAEAALVTIRDRQTAVADLLPAPLQQKVQRQVWRRRWERHRQACYAAAWRGALGGFFGFGAGMGFILAVGDNSLASVWADFQFLPGSVLSLILGSMVLTGPFSALAAAGGGFVLSALCYLSDGVGKRWSWLVSSVTTGFILGFSLVALVQFATVSDERRSFPNWLAGFVIGTVVTLAATAPLSWKRPLRAAFTIVAGIGAFLTVGLSGLSLQTATILLIFAGVTTGVGFFWGFNRSEAHVV